MIGIAKNGFSADIGSWDSGRNIPLVAKTLNDALAEANGKLIEMKRKFAASTGRVSTASVVQVYYNGKIVFDETNGKIGDCP